MPKLLLYCTKAKPYLLHMPKDDEEVKKGIEFSLTSGKEFREAYLDINDYKLNGKIVAECDFEVEEIKTYYNNQIYEGCRVHTINTYNISKLLELSCLSQKQLDDYLGENNGYAIHIKNLHIFDEPKELSEVYKIDNVGGILFTHILKKAPQNMMRVSVNRWWLYGAYTPNDVNILISIKPEWLCKILNGEKTIDIRKKVLKEMLCNEI